jgi:hypothetical protein
MLTLLDGERCCRMNAAFLRLQPPSLAVPDGLRHGGFSPFAGGWPRLRKNTYRQGPVQYSVGEIYA